MRNTLTYQQSTYENDKIKSAQMAVDTSLNERVLDVDTMNATVESETALVPFQQNTPVRFLRGGSQYALWYLAQITRVAPKLWALSMTSSLGRLTQMPHKGGIYNGVAASAIIDDICGVVPHFVGAAFQDVLLYGWLPYVAPSGENGAQTGSAKDNLLKVLFALNATVRDDADGTLRIENLSTAVSGRLGADRIYRDNASVVTEPTVTAVTVLEHQYITGSETTTLFEGTTVDGQVIVFRQPMSNLTATGFAVTESNANYAVVSAGSGTLTGTPYIHTTREITKPVTAAAIPNAVRIEDATLVGVTNSSDVVNRLVDYYSHRTYINVDATIDFEDAGDVVEIYDPFDKVLRQACIEKISPLVVSQTMKGRVSALVGFTPWQVMPFEDVRELLTGSGIWTVPEGVTHITAVLIGSGSGAGSGTDGEGAPAISNVPAGLPSNYVVYTAEISTPRKGGSGGEAGISGKVLRIELELQPGSTFSYSCSAGGAYNQGTGQGGDGGESTFGVYTTANGAKNANGYTDPITGELFAVDGIPGVNGGDGQRGKWYYSEKNPAPPIPVYVDPHVEYKGVVYSAGNKGQGVDTTTTTSYGSYSYMSLGGYGGGAAAGSNGGDGANGEQIALVNGRISLNFGGCGGAGADAIAPDAPTYGSGGNGGCGGGGAGGNGSMRILGDYQGTRYFDGQAGWPTLQAISGGKGSFGTNGGDGCIILYYRRPVTE